MRSHVLTANGFVIAYCAFMVGRRSDDRLRAARLTTKAR